MRHKVQQLKNSVKAQVSVRAKKKFKKVNGLRCSKLAVPAPITFRLLSKSRPGFVAAYKFKSSDHYNRGISDCHDTSSSNYYNYNQDGVYGAVII